MKIWNDEPANWFTIQNIERVAYILLTLISFEYLAEAFALLFNKDHGLLFSSRGVILLGIAYGVLIKDYADETIEHPRNRPGHLYPILWGVGFSIACAIDYSCPRLIDPDAFFLFVTSAIVIGLTWFTSDLRKRLRHKH